MIVMTCPRLIAADLAALGVSGIDQPYRAAHGVFAGHLDVSRFADGPRHEHTLGAFVEIQLIKVLRQRAGLSVIGEVANHRRYRLHHGVGGFGRQVFIEQAEVVLLIAAVRPVVVKVVPPHAFDIWHRASQKVETRHVQRLSGFALAARA